MTDRRATGWALILVLLGAVPAPAQTYSQRGFVEAQGVAFPQEAATDAEQLMLDVVAREEAFAKLRPWLQLAVGVDLRANTHDQVEASWTPDFTDRGVQRPAISVRRLAATFTRGPLTVDVGRQFVRWGKTDITTPTDHFAPRDFLSGVDAEFLGVWAARGVVQHGPDTVDVAWVPVFTPSRAPLLDQRWTVTGLDPSIRLVDAGGSIPGGSQVGVRWSRTSAFAEFSLSFFDGYNTLPNLEVSPLPLSAAGPEIGVARQYPALRAYGGDVAVPTKWATLKGEASYFTSPDTSTDEYVLYVVQAERQMGEWLLIGGYSGEAVVQRRAVATFAPDRGLARALVARASYAIDSNRNVAFESAVRQDGSGVYFKSEYSQGHGQHWRTTVGGMFFGGELQDFIGQYRRNSHVTLSLRYSF